MLQQETSEFLMLAYRSDIKHGHSTHRLRCEFALINRRAQPVKNGLGIIVNNRYLHSVWHVNL